MRKKKSKFLLFCLSFIPGCGEMYLGFMKRGISLLTFFTLGTVIMGYANSGIFAFIPIALWAYSFFEANNLGGMEDEDFYKAEDKYLFGLDEIEMDSVKNTLLGKYHKAFAIVLILLGVNLLWNVICGFLYAIFDIIGVSEVIRYITYEVVDNVTRAIIAVVIIWLGIKLIKGKQVELNEAEKAEYDNQKDVFIEAREIETEKEQAGGMENGR